MFLLLSSSLPPPALTGCGGYAGLIEGGHKGPVDKMRLYGKLKCLLHTKCGNFGVASTSSNRTLLVAINRLLVYRIFRAARVESMI